MSSKPSAKLVDVDERDLLMIEFEPEEMGVDSVMVGSIVTGTVYLVTHECPFCHSQMQTIGVGHGTYECSKCYVTRGRKVTMRQGFQNLENEE